MKSEYYIHKSLGHFRKREDFGKEDHGQIGFKDTKVIVPPSYVRVSPEDFKKLRSMTRSDRVKYLAEKK